MCTGHYRTKTTKLEEFPLVNPNEHEVVAAIGKVSGVKGKVFCLSCYAPPNLTRQKADQLLEFISDVVYLKQNDNFRTALSLFVATLISGLLNCCLTITLTSLRLYMAQPGVIGRLTDRLLTLADQ